MKRLTVLLLGLLFCTGGAWAETKVAVLDIQGAIRASKHAETFRNQLERDLVPDQERLKKLSDDANAMQEKLRKEADFLSQDEKQAMATEMQKKYQAFQQLSQQLKQKTQQQEQAFLSRMAPLVEEVVNELIKEQDIDLLVTRNTVHFVKPELVITSQVLERLNQK